MNNQYLVLVLGVVLLTVGTVCPLVGFPLGVLLMIPGLGLIGISDAL